MKIASLGRREHQAQVSLESIRELWEIAHHSKCKNKFGENACMVWTVVYSQM